MRKDNKIILSSIFIFFLLSLYWNGKYQVQRRERYLPYRFKSTMHESPTFTPHGLFYLDGFLWISSSYNHALLKYDLETQTVVKSLDIPCFEAAGLTYDEENFWVADYSRRTIYAVSPEGVILGTYETPYSTPWGLAWDGETLWILDVYGLKEYPNIFTNQYPHSLIYKYDPETGAVSDIIESPAPFAGDIAYRNGEIVVTGCTSGKIFHVNPETGETVSWYYSPDNFPRSIAAGEGNTFFVSGMTTREIWEVNLDMKAQYKDRFKVQDVTVPLWIVIIFSIFSLPIFLDELLKKEYTKEKSVFEKNRPKKWWVFWE